MSLSHPNVDFSRRLWTAVADADVETIRDMLADDVVWRTVGQNPLSGEYHGPEAVIDYLARVGETADEFCLELSDVFDNDEGAVVLQHATARRELKRLDMQYLLVLRIKDERVVDALFVPVDQRANDAFWS